MKLIVIESACISVVAVVFIGACCCCGAVVVREMATIHHCPLQCSAMQREWERRGLYCELLRRAAELFSRLNRKPFSQPRAEGREKERKKQGLKNKRFIFFSWVAVGIISVRIAGIDLTGWWLLVLERTQNVESSRKLVVCVCVWMDGARLSPPPSFALPRPPPNCWF